jgi:hypothetical protein
MNKELETLRKEYEGAPDSFIFRLRGEFVWDGELFSELIRAMKMVCQETESRQSIEKWIASVYWHMASFVEGHTTHPEFPRPYSPAYYRKAFTLIEELCSWLFNGYCPVPDPEKHFVIEKIE